MPEEWKKRPVEIKGARVAYYWHNILHIFNNDNMRRTIPFPIKDDDIFRIMIIGDSLTYGTGVLQEMTYSKLIEKVLCEKYRVETLNLGVCGNNSSQVLNVVNKFLIPLKPDLVIYGVCLNDFLEANEGQKTNKRRFAYPIPLPKALKSYMIERTLSGKFFHKSYDDLLLRFGLRLNFIDDILKDFNGYQRRFGEDVEQLNQLVIARGLPPVISMVLHQAPKLGANGNWISQIGEKLMTIAKMDVISAQPYFEKYNEQVLRVSQWEGHPNEDAHQIFAEEFVKRIKKRGFLEDYRR